MYVSTHNVYNNHRLNQIDQQLSAIVISVNSTEMVEKILEMIFIGLSY